jgi:hypothetical protein
LTESNGTEIQLSIKFSNNGTGYLIIKSPTVAGLMEAALEALDQAKMLNSVVEGVQAEATIREVFPETERASSGGGGAPAPQRPNGVPTKKCAHGVYREYKEGRKANGGKWSGEFCTVKGDPSLPQCAVAWDNG